MLELYYACIGRIKEKKMCNRPTAVVVGKLVGRKFSIEDVADGVTLLHVHF